jgi:hypothetical protein
MRIRPQQLTRHYSPQTPRLQIVGGLSRTPGLQRDDRPEHEEMTKRDVAKRLQFGRALMLQERDRLKERPAVHERSHVPHRLSCVNDRASLSIALRSKRKHAARSSRVGLASESYPHPPPLPILPLTLPVFGTHQLSGRRGAGPVPGSRRYGFRLPCRREVSSLREPGQVCEARAIPVMAARAARRERRRSQSSRAPAAGRGPQKR